MRQSFICKGLRSTRRHKKMEKQTETIENITDRTSHSNRHFKLTNVLNLFINFVDDFGWVDGWLSVFFLFCFFFSIPFHSCLWLIISSCSCMSLSLCVCLCVHTFVTLSKCRINSKWMIANRSEEKENGVFSLQVESIRNVWVLLLSHVWWQLHKDQTSEKGRIKRQENEKKTFARNPNIAAISFIWKSRKCWIVATVILKICHGKSMKTSYEETLPNNSESRPKMCMWPVSFALSLLLPPNTRHLCGRCRLVCHQLRG